MEATHDDFEQWSADSLSPLVVISMYGYDIAHAYADWIYLNEK